MKETLKTERLTFREKNANDKQWYKDNADRLDNGHIQSIYASDEVSEYKRMKVNYDLFNNKIN